MLAAHTNVFGTTESLGYLSEALQDFFNRCYYSCLVQTQGLPYALYIRAGHDITGIRRDVETIVTGLRWRKIAEPLICHSIWREDFVTECRELRTLVAAGLKAECSEVKGGCQHAARAFASDPTPNQNLDHGGEQQEERIGDDRPYR